MPKVSVIISVYNVAPYLRQCLDSVVSQTLHLYAVWTADQSTYTVRFNKNDGSGATANQTFKVGETKSLLWKDSELKWSRSGYTFKGWAESASGSVKYANGAKMKNLAMDGGTKHLYAIWRLAD